MPIVYHKHAPLWSCTGGSEQQQIGRYTAAHLRQTTGRQPRESRHAMTGTCGTVYSHGLAAVVDLHKRDVLALRKHVLAQHQPLLPSGRHAEQKKRESDRAGQKHQSTKQLLLGRVRGLQGRDAQEGQLRIGHRNCCEPTDGHQLRPAQNPQVYTGGSWQSVVDSVIQGVGPRCSRRQFPRRPLRPCVQIRACRL